MAYLVAVVSVLTGVIGAAGMLMYGREGRVGPFILSTACFVFGVLLGIYGAVTFG